MKKIILILIGITYSNSILSQEYIEVLRAADNNILVNPALAGIDGRNSLTILDTRSIRGSRFNSALSYASASFRMTDNLIYCPAPGYFSNNSRLFFCHRGPETRIASKYLFQHDGNSWFLPIDALGHLV